MTTEELQSTDWPEFCRRFSEVYEGALLTIETIGPSGRRAMIADELPLHEMVMDKSDACSDFIRVQAGQSGHPKTTHEIVEPIKMKIVENAKGGRTLLIEAENGTTLITFPAGKLSEVLSEFAGELREAKH
jgi:hypothetical protein